MIHKLRFIAPSLLFLFPGALWAHSPIQGLASFYNGFLHPFLVPAHLLTVLALGFLFGQQGANRMQSAILAYLGASVTGLVVMGYFGLIIDVESPLLVMAAVLGLLVALSRSFPLPFYLFFAVTAGLMLGLDSVQSVYIGKQKLGALVGTGLGVYLGLLYATVLAQLLQKRHWMQIAVRILGSWIGASALLTLTLVLAPKPVLPPSQKPPVLETSVD